MSSKHQPTLNFPLSLRDEAVSFDPEQFDNLIRDQGVTFCHERALACPLGLIDPNDERHPQEEHATCTKGFLYTKAGKVTCGFTGNNTNTTMSDMGRLDGSSAQIVIPRYYDQETPSAPLVRVEMLKYDRLYLDEEVETQINVPSWERIATTVRGIDRTEFPIVSVTDLIDSRGIRYVQDQDFRIKDGDIVWIGSKRPSWDSENNRGTVYSIRYRYRPYWLVDRILHEVRVAPVANPFTGQRGMVQMPQGAEIKREYFFRTDQRNPDGSPQGAPSNPRTALHPPPLTYPTEVPTGGFGPRQS